MKKGLLFFAFLFLSMGMLLAQQRTVKGIVTSKADGEAIIGASVVVKSNKTVGGATNIEGRFNFKVPTSAKTLIVSYVGFKTLEVPISDGDMKIALEADSEALEEVMVVAFGTAKKSTFTGSSVVLDKKKLEKSQAADVSKTLEGLVPGLQVSSASGRPGEKTELRIRGIGSINASAEPLIIVDGAPYASDLNSINPQDIESLNVLKDAASAALYGARGANGVILITTKTGKTGRVSVNFDARMGVNQRGVPEYSILTSPGEYYELFWESLKNQKLYSGEKGVTEDIAREFASKSLIKELGYNIYKGVDDDKVVGLDGKLVTNPTLIYEEGSAFNNWADELYRPQMRQEYNLSLSRGVNDNNVFFSVGYLNDKGFNLSTGFDRISSRLAYDTKLYPWLKVSASTQLSHTNVKNRLSEGGNFSNTFNWTRMIAPIYPVYKHDVNGKRIINPASGSPYDDGEIYVEQVNGQDVVVNGPRAYSTLNLVEQQRRNLNRDMTTTLSQNLRADVDLFWGLKFNTTATYTSFWTKYFSFYNPKVGDGRSYKGQLKREDNQQETINWNQVLSWDKTFGDLSLQAMVGHETYSSNYYEMNGTVQNLLLPASYHLNSGASLVELKSYERDYRVEGYFSQLTADYKDRYYFSASIRRDGSSVFAPENRWGTFWSLGASWRLKNESFLKNVRAVDNLKLRFSYGAQGNDYLYNPEGYRNFAPYEDQYEIITDGTAHQVVSKFRGNREITWEKNHNFNVGLEFNLWNGLLSGEFDFFQRKTSDMLFDLPTPTTTGFETRPVNVGDMQNVGFEFSLNSALYNTKNVSVSVGINGATYKNTILRLPDEFKKDGIASTYRIMKEGGSVYDYHLVKYAGVDPETGNSRYYIQKEIKNDKGEVVGHEFKASPSEEYSSKKEHRQFIGTAIPKLVGGFNANVKVFDFDFTAQFAYRIGGLVYDGLYANLMGTGRAGTNWHTDIRGRWTPENRNTDIPRIQAANQGIVMPSDRFMIDGSYLSVRSLTLGYTLPQSLVQKVRLQSVRVYFSADNLALWSRRQGLDPRLALNGAQSESKNSAMRTLSCGLNVSL